MTTNYNFYRYAITMLFFLVLTQGNFIHAQELEGIKIDENGNVGVGTVSPHPSAKMQIFSKTKGVLIPSMTWAEMQAISPKTEGLMAYRLEKNSDLNGPFYYDSNQEEWVRMSGTSVSWNDIVDVPDDLADGDDVGGDAGFFGSDGNKLYPLDNKHVLAGGFGGNTTSTEDWNNIKSNGIYDKMVISSPINNGPPEINKFFHIQNWEYGTKDGNGNITQLAIPYSYQTNDIDGAMWLRGYSIEEGGAWSNWKQVSNDPYGINTNFGGSPTKLMASNQSPYYGYAMEIKDSYVGGFARILGGIIAENPTHVSDYIGSYGFHGGGGSETEPGYISKFFVDVTGNQWNTTDFQVTPTGVGIGTVPTKEFDVDGDARIRGLSDAIVYANPSGILNELSLDGLSYSNGTLAVDDTGVELEEGQGINITGGNGEPYEISAEGANANLVVDSNNGFDAFTFLDQFSKYTSTFKEGSGINLEKDGSFLKISSEEIDGDIENELQTLTFDGVHTLDISLGNEVNLSALKDDPNAWKMNGNAFSPYNTPKLGFTGNYPLRIYTSNLERMRISEDGKVGIGTSSPDSDLHIEGNIVMNLTPFSDDGTLADVISIGPSAGVGGKFNVFLGHSTGTNTNGFYNTFIGRDAGELNVSGAQNNFIGKEAGKNNASGNNNILMGSNSGEDVKTTNGNIGIGQGTLSTDSSQDLIGANNIAIGSYAFDYTGDDIVVNSIAIGQGVTIDAPNIVRIGNAGISSIGGFKNWTNISDQRFKTNIVESVPGIDFIKALRPVQYNFDAKLFNDYVGISPENRNSSNENAKTSIVQSGFLAQEVETAANNLGFEFSGVDAPKSKNGYYGLRYSEFVVPLVKAVQEQQDIIDKLEERLAKLENCACNPIDKIQIEQNTEIQNSLDSDSFAVKVYPNPARQNLTLDIETSQEGLSEIKVFNNTGQLIEEESTLLLNGKNQHQLSCGEWGSGVYFITTTHLGVTVSRKVIVTK